MLLFLRLHRLVDHVPNGVRLPLHPLGGVGVGVQREACAVVAQCVGEGLSSLRHSGYKGCIFFINTIHTKLITVYVRFYDSIQHLRKLLVSLPQ